MRTIPYFETGSHWSDWEQLNEIVDACNAFLRMVGDQHILVNHTSKGCGIKLAMDMVNARIGRPSPTRFAKVTHLYNWQGYPWTAYDTAAEGTVGFISCVKANPCSEWDGAAGIGTATTLWLKTSSEPRTSFVGMMDIAVGDVVGYVRAGMWDKEQVLGDSEFTYDGYIVAGAGAHGACYNLGYPDTANTYDLTDIFGGLTSLSAIGNVKVDRSGRIVAWKDSFGGAWQWHYDQFP